jgi:uncharacterized repeat protein (TIGR01451 family)
MIERAASLLLVLVATLMAGLAHAAGTPAGTTITNRATANYSVNGTPAAVVSSSVTITVDELISVRVTPPAGPTGVASPDTNRPLVFVVTNVGNGPESFTLAPGYAIAGDAFDPTPGSAGTLFLDVNGDGQYAAGVDTPITGPLTLNPDQSVQVLLLANIPTGQASGNQGKVTLTATSTTPGAAGAAPGTVLPGQGTGGVDAMVGVGPGGPADSGADDLGTGIFQISGGLVGLAKTLLSVVDPFGNACTVTGGSQSPCLVPGATLEYRITVTVTSAASAVAQNLVITDDVPANTSYSAGSIRVNGSARTDAVDADNASCAGCGNGTGTLTVNLGNVTGTAAGVVTTIDYRVRIN